MAKAKKKIDKSLEDKMDLLNDLAGDLPLFNDDDYETKSDAIPSGSLSLDMAIGIGGLPRGAIVDVFGGESAGKSLISIMAIAQIQKAGGVAVVWDAERSYSKNLAWMRVNGVDTKRLKFIKLRPEQGAEVGFEAVIKIAKAGAADLIVIDSVPALLPQAAIDKPMTENAKLAARAGMLTDALPKLTGVIDDSKTCLMFINQMRANIGGGMYGPSEKETGGFALRFFASVRLAVRKVSKSLKIENDVPIGHRVHVKVIKNKVGSPHRQAEFDLYYNSGVDNASEIADILIGAKAVEKRGGWYYYEGEKFQGLANLVVHIKAPKNFDKAWKKCQELSKSMNAFGVRKDEEASDTAGGAETLSIE